MFAKISASFLVVVFLTAWPGVARAQINPCVDPAGAARHISASNPGLAATQQGLLVIAEALKQEQEMYGCRAPKPVYPDPPAVYIAPPPMYVPPPAPRSTGMTRCSWVGAVWTCYGD